MFVDEVKAEEKGLVCGVGLLLAGEDELRDEITAVLDDPARQSAAITRVLKKHGHEVSASTIATHRRRASGTGCACPL